MRKNIKNDKVLRAIAIGLATMIAMTSTPVTVSAEEPEPDPDDTLVSQNSSSDIDTTVAHDAVNDAETAAENATDFTNNNIDQSQTGITNAANDLGAELDDTTLQVIAGQVVTNDTNAIDNNKDNKVDVEVALNGVDATLKELDTQEGVVAGLENAYNGFADSANSKVDNGITAANDAKKAVGTDKRSEKTIENVVDDAEPAVENAENNIPTAGSVEEAEQLKKDAEDAVAAAGEEVTESRKNYNEAEGRYNAAYAEWTDLTKEKGVIADTKEKLGEASFDNNGKLISSSGAIGRYYELQDLADQYAAEAEAELKRLADAAAGKDENDKDVSGLKFEADQARESFNASGYGYIAALEARIEDKLSKGETPSWADDYRPLAEAMVEIYIVPEKLGGKEVKPTEWHDFKGQYFYPDGTESTKGDVLKYGIVRYKDENGKDCELFFNYKTADCNKPGTRGGIVIFEKVKHNMLGKDEITDDELAKLDSGETIFYTDNNKNQIGALVKIGDQYARYDFSSAGETTDLVTDKECVEISKVSREESFTTEEGKLDINADGKLVKSVKAVVTRTTTSNDKTTGRDDLADEGAAEEAYKAMLQELINALKNEVNENQFLKIGGTVFLKGDEADLTGYEKTATSKYSVKYKEKWEDDGSTVRSGDAYYRTEELAKDGAESYLERLSEMYSEARGLELKAEGKIKILTTSNNDMFGYEISDIKFYRIGNIDVIANDESEAKEQYTGPGTFISATEVKRYGYKAVDMLIQTVKSGMEVISQTLLSPVSSNALNVEYRNDNWYSGKLLLCEYDSDDPVHGTNNKHVYTDGKQGKKEDRDITSKINKAANDDFRTNVANAAKIADNYRTLSSLAQTTREKALSAWKEVETLRGQIAQKSVSVNLKALRDWDTELAQLKADLTNAGITLTNAENKWNILNERVKNLSVLLQNRIDELTTDPDDTPAASDDTTTGTTVALTGTGTTTMPGTGVPTDPIGGAARGAGADRSGVLGVRADNPDGTGDVTGNAADAGNKKAVAAAAKNNKTDQADKNVVKIDNNEVPLSAMPAEDGINMSWLWIVIVALLGAIGKKMYDDHKKKVEAKEQMEAVKKNNR